MKVRLEDLRRMGVVALLTAPPIAFITFDFVFPNVSWPSLEKNLLVAFLLSILFGTPTGYLTRRTDMAMVSVLVNVTIGYSLAVLAYAAPFMFYDFSVIFPGLYFLFFVQKTVVLVMLLVLGGIIGTVLGQLISDAVRRDETSQSFSRPGA